MRVTSLPADVFTCDDFPKPYILHQPGGGRGKEEGEEEGDDLVSLVGSDLELRCRAASTSPAEMSFRWKKDGEEVRVEECPEEEEEEEEEMEEGDR